MEACLSVPAFHNSLHTVTNDVVPHQWVRDMLQAIRAPTLVRRTIKKVMRHWRTGLEVRTTAGTAVEPVRFRRGLFQGDSLSPILLVLTVAPLSSYLGLTGGVESAHHGSLITHLLFMDDLKVFERSKEDLEAAVEGVEELSAAVGMTLGAGKCAVAHLRSGRIRQRGGVELRSDSIEEISDSTYRYLGIEQVIGIRSRETKDKVVREYLRRVQIVWSSPLSAGAKVRGHNSWAVAVLRY